MHSHHTFATIGRKANGLKVVEGGKIRGKKKMTAATRLNPVFRPYGMRIVMEG